MYAYTHVINMRPHFNATEILKCTMLAYASLLCAISCLGEDDITAMQEHPHLLGFLLFLLHRINHEVILKEEMTANKHFKTFQQL